jgi:hypothetical protein
VGRVRTTTTIRDVAALWLLALVALVAPSPIAVFAAGADPVVAFAPLALALAAHFSIQQWISRGDVTLNLAVPKFSHIQIHYCRIEQNKTRDVH